MPNLSRRPATMFLSVCTLFTAHAWAEPLAAATLIIERPSDAFVFPASEYYPGLVGELITDNGGEFPSGPIYNKQPALLQTAQSLRTALTAHGASIQDQQYAQRLDAGYQHASEKYLSPNIDQVVHLDIASELPDGRPDYRAVTRANHFLRKSARNRMTIEVSARPVFLPGAGHLALITGVKLRGNKTHADWPRSFLGTFRVFSKPLGNANAGDWFANDQALYQSFIRCATAETMHMLRQTLDGDLRQGKRRERLQREGFFTESSERGLRYAAAFNPIEQRDHRVRLGYDKKHYGSVIPQASDLSSRGPTIKQAQGLEECAGEPGADAG
ncbi:MAG: hypothetical protein AB8G16_11975 [Gammaproteobacteria bacterium]